MIVSIFCGASAPVLFGGKEVQSGKKARGIEFVTLFTTSVEVR